MDEVLDKPEVKDRAIERAVDHCAVSKRIDDGARCYPYMEDTGKDPLKASGQWVCCDSDSQWRADPAVHLTAALASNDKFLQLRMSLDAELDKYFGEKRSEKHAQQALDDQLDGYFGKKSKTDKTDKTEAAPPRFTKTGGGPLARKSSSSPRRSPPK